MKNIIVLAVLLLVICTASFAQDPRYSRHSDRYTASYYAPLLWGVNGHRSVADENRVMEETLAEMRRQRMYDTMSPAEIAAMRKRRVLKQEVRNDAIAARREKEQSNAAKNTANKTEPMAVKKEAEQPKPKKQEQPSTYNPFIIN